MKGTVVATWLQSMQEVYGAEAVEKVLNANHWGEDRVINPMEDIDDTQITKIVNDVANSVGKSSSELWREIGKANIKSFSKWFPSYFERYSLKGFLSLMDNVHQQLTRMIKGANPPRIIATELSPDELELRYSSKRGMFDYFLGLLDGSAEFFNEKITVKELERGEDGGAKFLRVYIKLEKKVNIEKKYTISRVISAGLIKNIPVKISLISSILLSAGSFVLFPGQGIEKYAILGVFSFAVMFGLSIVVLKPFKFIEEELVKLKELDFTEKTVLKTGDKFEKLSKAINLIKETVSTDFLLLKGGTDDMHSFTVAFSEIATKMEKVSDGISNVGMEVASGAVHQAEEIEKSVGILNSNIESINSITAEQTQGKENLEQAVNNIEKSFEDTQQVARMIVDVKDSFSQVNKQGEELAQQVNDILSIVTTVASVADQTNLLALNAAIEAARAGEAGRGFAVVADEIRKLAENSKSAVKIINDNLMVFTGKVSDLVERINAQFNQLETSNRTLEEVLAENRNSTDQIGVVAQSIAQLIAKLSKETDSLAFVYGNIHSLAAIAQENSAASEEMSANVSEYSERIKELVSHIQRLEELSDLYREELRKYKI